MTTKPLGRKMWIEEDYEERKGLIMIAHDSALVVKHSDRAAALVIVFTESNFEQAAREIWLATIISREEGDKGKQWFSFEKIWPELKKRLVG